MVSLIKKQILLNRMRKPYIKATTKTGNNKGQHFGRVYCKQVKHIRTTIQVQQHAGSNGSREK